MSIPKILAEFIRFTEIRASLKSYWTDESGIGYRFALLSMRSDLVDIFRMFFESIDGVSLDMNIKNHPIQEFEITIQFKRELVYCLEMVKMSDYGRIINDDEHWEYDDEIELNYELVIE